MKIIIIGGDAAGMSAAMEIVRNHKEAQILVLERGGIYSYGQCGLPYVIDGRVSNTAAVIARSVDEFRDKYGIDARTFHEVTSIDITNKIVKGQHLKTSTAFEFSYDQLLIASGASPMIPSWYGTELSGIHTVKSIPQMDQLMVDLQHVRHATVIGGGYIGLEVTEALKLRGLDVRMIHRGQQLMNSLHPELAGKVYEEAVGKGVEVCLEEDVIGFEGDDRVTTVVTKSARYATDLVIVATGVTPNTGFADGLAKLANGALIVNEKMQTSIPEIYAAGDCATHYHRVKRADDYIPLGTTANKQGRIAGLNIAGREAIFKGIVGTSILKFFDVQIGMTGTSELEAKGQKIEVESFSWETNNVASYYATVTPLFMRLVTERGSRKLLGLQMVGESGVDKRIDVFATALFNEMSLEQLVDLDLAYAPPFNGVWDALQQISKRFS